MHWDKTNKKLTSFKMVIFFVCFVPVRLLRPNKAVFVLRDCKLQRAYSRNVKFVTKAKYIDLIKLGKSVSEKGGDLSPKSPPLDPPLSREE